MAHHWGSVARINLELKSSGSPKRTQLQSPGRRLLLVQWGSMLVSHVDIPDVSKKHSALGHFQRNDLLLRRTGLPRHLQHGLVVSIIVYVQPYLAHVFTSYLPIIWQRFRRVATTSQQHLALPAGALPDHLRRPTVMGDPF